ncbi:MAG: ABC transporter ATP-binding protein [Actinomycetota bacterium]
MTETAVNRASLTGGAPPLSLSVEHVDVKYRVYEDQVLNAKELFGRGFRSRRSTVIHAVRDVSFTVEVGEAVGVIGANGSGKSTLLRAIAGLQSVAAGRVLVRGEPHLLGVGAALKPQLSGYRNVMLGGLAMGMERDEVEALVPTVADFSGLGDAMRRPMNTYSSGMRARLAFSIATLQIPDVLLIDEALAVGDRDFRQRSLDRIKQIREDAGTVLMVTHNLSEIRQTCSRCLWMREGELIQDGPVDEVLEAYDQDRAGA